VELFVLIVYIIDFKLREHSRLGNQIEKVDLWCAIKKWLIALMILEIVIAVIVGGALGTTGRVMRLFRPYFLIEKGPNVRKVFIATWASIQAAFASCSLLALHLLFFSVLGWYLFSPTNGGNNDGFINISEALWTLMVLLTTANFPACMMPSYHKAQGNVFFFIVFLLIGTFFVIRLICTIVYSAYNEVTSAEVKVGIGNQNQSLVAAFLTLTEHLPLGNQYVDRAMFHRILKRIRPDLAPEFYDVIFDALDEDQQNKLALLEWMRICTYIEVSVSVEPKVTYSETDKFTPLLESPTSFIWNLFSEQTLASVESARAALREYVTSVPAVVFFIMCVGAAIAMEVLNQELAPTFPYYTTSYIILIVFATELAIKWFAFGSKSFFVEWDNFIDFGIMVAEVVLVCVQASVGSFGTLSSVYTIVTLFRICKVFKPIQSFLVTIAGMGKNLFAFFGTYFCFYYFFAVIGMWCFAGVITENSVSEIMSLDPAAGAFYSQLYYYENNMNDLAHAMVTLFELTVINDWQVVSSGYILLKGKGARVYFTIFYGTSTFIFMNILFSFIMDAYLRSMAEVNTDMDDPNVPTAPAWKRRLLKCINKRNCNPVKDFDKEMLKVTRTPHSIHLYRVLYPQFNETVEVDISESRKAEVREQIQVLRSESPMLQHDMSSCAIDNLQL
jgi:hypothetical protein